MKNFIINLSLFIFGFIAIVIIPILIMSSYDNLDKSTSEDHNIISLQTNSDYDSLDMLFIGNSYCYSSVNTFILDSFNIKAFNFGIATSGVQFYDLLIDDYLENVTTAPKKVLILVSPMTFSSKSDNFSAYPIHRYLKNEKSNFSIAMKYNKLDELISMYKKSVKKFLGWILRESFSRNNAIVKRTNNKGFFQNDVVINDSIIANDEYLYLSLKNDTFPKSKIKTLLNIAKRIQNNGSEVIFYELPTNMLSKYFNKLYIDEYDKSKNELSKQYKFITIQPSLFKIECYRNIDHMNNSGAEIATTELIKQLEIEHKNR